MQAFAACYTCVVEVHIWAEDSLGPQGRDFLQVVVFAAMVQGPSLLQAETYEQEK